MFCRPIKLQRFDSETSMFTAHLSNVWLANFSALSYKAYKKSYKIIEDFLREIDPDLIPCAKDLRKNGFTSTASAKYLTEEDLRALPEGHKRLMMNMITRFKTPERNCQTSKRKELPSPSLPSPSAVSALSPASKSPARKKSFLYFPSSKPATNSK